jgi:3-oxoacyl-[acyl-carrier-protein] synthase III
MNYAKIIGTGSYLPDKVVPNSELEQMLNTTDAWIVNRTGIRQRHLANAQETTAFMATQAAKQALAAAGLSSVDMILVATTSPDAFFPNTACLVQAALGLTQCPALDISAACSGFSYALTVAEQFIRTGSCQHILVIASDTLSHLVDWLDRNTCILFGDGAGSIVLSASNTPGIVASQLYAEGEHHALLYANNTRAPDKGFIKMKGPALFRKAIAKMATSIQNLLSQQAIPIEQIDWLIPHQANLNIIKAIAKQLNFPEKRIVTTIADQANTSAASIPLALDHAIRDKRIQPGQRLLLASFGGGITWGATLIQY